MATVSCLTAAPLASTIASEFLKTMPRGFRNNFRQHKLTYLHIAVIAACLAALAASPDRLPTNEQALEQCLKHHPQRYCRITYAGEQ